MPKQLATAATDDVSPLKLTIRPDWTLQSQNKTPVAIGLEDNSALKADEEINIAEYLTFNSTKAIDALFAIGIAQSNADLTKAVKYTLTHFNGGALSATKYVIEVKRDVDKGQTVAKAVTVNGVATGVEMVVTGVTASALGTAIAGVVGVTTATVSAPLIAIGLGSALVIGFAYDALGADTAVESWLGGLYDKFVPIQEQQIGPSSLASAKTEGIAAVAEAGNQKEYVYIPNPGGNNSITLGQAVYYTEEQGSGNDLFIRTGSLAATNGKHSIIDGGAGQDTISYEQVTNLTNGIEIALQDGGLNYGVSTPRGADYGLPLDLLDFIEHAVGTKYDDSIIGSDVDNNLKGMAGADTILGGKGNDTLDGGDENDSISGEDGVDSVLGGSGNDTIFGGNENDIIDAGAGNDSVDGGKGRDVIISGGGNDTLAGGGGADVFNITGGGNVTINDTGRDDVLQINGTRISGEAVDNGNGTYSLGGYTITETGSGLSVSGNTNVSLNGWSEGSYGISLEVRYISPIVFDLDRDGLELLPIGERLFDIDDDGIAEPVGWVKPDDGFLVMDKNANGMIDDVTEMFGNNGGTSAWDKMKLLDSNKDGALTSVDTNWTKLKIWRDANGNALTETGELSTLPTAGISRISLTKEAYTTSDYTITQGNVIDGRGSWTTTGGAAGKYYDVYFDTNQRWGQYIEKTPIDSSFFIQYPFLERSGNVIPLYAAIAKDASLKTLVENLNSTSKFSTNEQWYNKVEELVIRWTGKDGIVAGSRGTGVNAKAVAAEEAFWGGNTSFTPWNAGALNANDISTFNDYWGKRLDDMKQALLVQGAFSGLFPNAYFDFQYNQIAFNDSLENVISRAKAGISASADLSIHNNYWSTIFGILKYANGSDDLSFKGSSTFDENDIKFAILNAAKPGTSIVEFYRNGTSGNDSIQGNYGTDSITGGAGNDTLNGGSAADTLVGGTGNNHFYGEDGVDIFVIGKDTVAVTDTIWDLDSYYVYTDYNEKIDLSALGTNLALTLQQVGVDTTFSVGSHKIILKNTYADNLSPRFFAGVSSVSFNNYSTVPTDRSDKISGTANADTIDGLYGDDTISGLGGNDSLSGYYGFDSISGDAGNDTLIGFNGGDTLVGGAGNDRLFGDIGLDVLSGGAGNNTFTGGTDTDLFIIGKDTVAAADVITDFSTLSDASGKYEKVDLSALGSSLAIKVQGISYSTRITVGNHTITLNGTDIDELTINHFVGVGSFIRTYSTVPSNDADSIMGTANADTIDGLYDNDTIFGLDGNDSLRGDYGNDSLIGGKGNDILSGGPGDDIFVINQGEGLDTIFGSGDSDTIIFVSGITWLSTQFSRVSANDILITLPGGGTVLLKDATANDLIENFKFSDGSTKTFSDIKARLSVGTIGNDSITGFEYSNDTLSGLDGNDTILGLGGNDSLIGGKGNDSFTGGSGDDIFVINQGDGIDTILGSSDNDTVVFGAGITWTNLQLSRASTSDILITTPGGGTVLLKGATSNDLIENYKFSDGAIKTFADVKARLLASTSGADSITAFDNSNDTVNGLDGNDTILGLGGDDSLMGGKGNDSLDGGRGSDIFLINQGDGTDTINGYLDSDTVVFGSGITWASLQFSRVNTNDVLIVIPGGGSVLVKDGAVSNYGIETFQFADGSTKTFADMQSRMGSVGTAGNDSITGFDSSGDNLNGLDGNDTIKGLGGNDSLIGGKDNDSLDGGRNDDIYVINQGDGIDTINGSLESDTIVFGAGITWANLQFSRINANDVFITVPGGGSVLVQNGAVNNYGIETFKFSDNSIKTFEDMKLRMVAVATTGNDSISGFDSSNDTISGLDGNDTILGYDGNDSLIGGKGNDSLDGGRNNDIYVVNQGDGADTVNGSLENDTIVFGTGITWTNLQFSRVSANDVFITVPSGGTLLIQNGAVSNYGIETFKFSDNSIKTFEDMKLRMVAVATTGNDSITGFDSSNDTVSGLDGNDTIIGWRGNDSLIGGKGNDSLDGGRDNDIFVINQGDGLDTVNGNLESDTIVFGTGITWANLQFSRVNANDVMITIPGGGSVLVKDGAVSNYGIETFQFADNSTKTFADMQTKIASLSTSGNDVITGFDNRNDLLSGAAGNDSIKAYSGDDTLLGDVGNDTIIGDAGNDLLVGGAGVDLMTGGSGLDAFDFNSLTESTKTAADTITDFSTTDDKIDLRGLGFTGIVAGNAVGTQLGFVYDSLAKDTIITAVGDFKIVLDGSKALDAGDFIFS